MDNIFDDFFPGGIKSLEKGFVVSSEWRAEITKWLVCIHAIDPRYYSRAKTRVVQDTLKQEEVLAEIRSIYFLQKNGCTITALEPGRVDLTFTDVAGTEWYAEVKCPSYVQEIFERDLSRADKFARKQQPKFINEEGFSFDFTSRYPDPIGKSVAQFEPGNNNLLIISDNLFMSLAGDPFFEEDIKTQLRISDPQDKISAVLLLHVQLLAFDNIFEYNARLAEITTPLQLLPGQSAQEGP